MLNTLPVKPAKSAPGRGIDPSHGRKSGDPHLGLRFWVQIDGVEVAGFTECSSPTVETEMFEYTEGGLNAYTHKLPVRTKYGNITLKRGIDEGHDLWRWFNAALEARAPRKNVSIVIYDSRMKERKRYDLRAAWPVKWTGPDLKADAGAVAVETLEFVHEGFTVTNL